MFLNVVKTISDTKIKRAIEISATLIEICCLSKVVSCKQEGSSSTDKEIACFGW